MFEEFLRIINEIYWMIKHKALHIPYSCLIFYNKVGLKLNIQKTKIMASGSITSWEIDGETVETVSDLIFGLQNHCKMVTAAMKLQDTYFLEEK